MNRRRESGREGSWGDTQFSTAWQQALGRLDNSQDGWHGGRNKGVLVRGKALALPHPKPRTGYLLYSVTHGLVEGNALTQDQPIYSRGVARKDQLH